MLVEFFPEIVDLDFTARMEDRLDDVARGQHQWVPMVRDFWEPFSEKLVSGRANIAKQVELTDIVCPVSGHLMVKRFGRNGWFLGCSGYPECKHTMPVPGEEPEEPPELPGVGEVCPQCGQGHLVAKRGRFGPFVGCDRYPECRYIKKDAAPVSEQFGTCPKCGQGTVVTKRARRGGRPFWGCDRYPDCDYATWARPGTSSAGDGTGSADGLQTDGDRPASTARAGRDGVRRHVRRPTGGRGRKRSAGVGDGSRG
jgi:DNA topoisomerase-1